MHLIGGFAADLRVFAACPWLVKLWARSTAQLWTACRLGGLSCEGSCCLHLARLAGCLLPLLGTAAYGELDHCAGQGLVQAAEVTVAGSRGTGATLLGTSLMLTHLPLLPLPSAALPQLLRTEGNRSRHVDCLDSGGWVACVVECA